MPDWWEKKNIYNVLNKIWLILVLNSLKPLSRRYGVGKIQVELGAAEEREKLIFCGTV